MSSASSIFELIRRGLAGLCPNCNKGKVFATYLKVNDQCSHCGERLNRPGIDDAPAYLTIVIIGHFFVPILILTEYYYAPPLWLTAIISLPLTLALTLYLLPKLKGVVVGVLWHLRQSKSCDLE